MEHVYRPWPHLRALPGVLLVSLTLLVGCGDPARPTGPHHGLGHGSRTTSNDEATNPSPQNPDPCWRHDGLWQWLRALRP